MAPETTTGQQFQCPECPRTFQHRSGLMSHRRSAHGYRDPVASAKWAARKMVIAARAKRREKEAAARAADREFVRAEKKQKADFELSQKKANRGPGGKYKCALCGYRCAAPTALGFHKKRAHGIAGQSAASAYYQKVKQQKETPTPVVKATKGRFPCPECGQIYKFAKGLGRHRLSAHGVPGSSKSNIARRRKQQAATQPTGIVLAASASPLTCEVCGKSFKNATGLSHHRARIHKGLAIHHETTIHLGGITHGNGSSFTGTDEAANFFWLGWTTREALYTAEINAARIGASTENFTGEFKAILGGSNKALRQRLRLPDHL